MCMHGCECMDDRCESMTGIFWSRGPRALSYSGMKPQFMVLLLPFYFTFLFQYLDIFVSISFSGTRKARPDPLCLISFILLINKAFYYYYYN